MEYSRQRDVTFKGSVIESCITNFKKSKVVPLYPLEKQVTEDDMAGWHHRLNGHESEQAPGESEGQGSLACCSP